MTESSDKWQNMVKLLMAKAQDPATPETEREAIMDKVTYLMAKYQIEQAMLDASNNKHMIVIRKEYLINNPYKNDRRILLSGIVKAFGCQSIWVTDYIGDGHKVIVFGYEDDQEKVLMLYLSLTMQLFSCLNTVEKPADIHGKTFNSSWVKGFVITVRRRVLDSAKRAKQDIRETSQGSGMDVVLANRWNQIAVAILKEFPKLRTVNSSINASNNAGYAAGSAAGRSADIGHGRLGSTRKAIGS